MYIVEQDSAELTFSCKANASSCSFKCAFRAFSAASLSAIAFSLLSSLAVSSFCLFWRSCTCIGIKSHVSEEDGGTVEFLPGVIGREWLLTHTVWTTYSDLWWSNIWGFGNVARCCCAAAETSNFFTIECLIMLRLRVLLCRHSYDDDIFSSMPCQHCWPLDDTSTQSKSLGEKSLMELCMSLKGKQVQRYLTTETELQVHLNMTLRVSWNLARFLGYTHRLDHDRP